MQQLFTILFALSAFAFSEQHVTPLNRRGLMRVAAIGENCGPRSLVCQENAQCVVPKGKGLGASGVCLEVLSYGDKPCGGNGPYPTRCAPFFTCNASKCINSGGFGPVNTGSEGSRCGAIFGDNCQSGLVCSGGDRAEGVCLRADGAALNKRALMRVAAIGENCGPNSLVCQENAQCVVPKGKGLGASGVCREVLSYGDKPCGGNGPYPTRCAPFFTCSASKCVNSGGFGPVNTGSEGSRCGAIFGDNCQSGLVCSGDDRAEGVCLRADGAALNKRGFLRVAAIGENCGPSSLMCQENAQCVVPKGKGLGASGVCREVLSYGDKPCGGNSAYPTRCAPFFTCDAKSGNVGKCVSFGGFGPVNTGSEGSRCGAIFGDNCQKGLVCNGDNTAEGVCVKN